MIFKYAYEIGLLEHPVRFGSTFKMPSKKALRQVRQAKPPRMFEAEELRTILDNADMPLKAIILLGINCGFGATDVANLPMTAFDFNRQIVDFSRPKTADERHCTLWPETIEAVQEAIEKHKTPKDKADEHLLFITKYGDASVTNG